MSKKRWKEGVPPSELCDSSGPEDGLDPRYFFDRRSHRADDRKQRQLCKQVEHAVGLALLDADSDILSSLHIQAVEPAPDSRRLELYVAWGGDCAECPSAAEILEELGFHAARIRMEVTEAIHRKRTPELVFQVVAEGGADE